MRRPISKFRPPIVIIIALSVTGLVLVAQRAFAAPKLTLLPGARNPVGVSNDGKTVAGWYSSYAGWIWTESEGLRSVADLPGMPGDNQVQALSSDGRVIGGHTRIGVTGPGAWIWSFEGGYRSLGVFPHARGEWGVLQGLSLDGSIAYGWAESPNGDPLSEVSAEEFRWTAGSGLVPTGPHLSGDRTVAVSDDGRVLAKNTVVPLPQAAVWTQATGDVGLGFLPGTNESVARGMSSDGSVIVGISSGSSSASSRPFRWTQAAGMTELVLADSFEPLRITDDGSRILGVIAVPGTPLVIWDKQHGVRDLTALVTNSGIDLGGRTLYDESGGLDMSPDGRFIVGEAHRPLPGGGFESEVFLLDLGAPVPEPRTLALTVIGTIAIGCGRIRRRGTPRTTCTRRMNHNGIN
jgi:uncharacterized membrane protein